MSLFDAIPLTVVIPLLMAAGLAAVAKIAPPRAADVLGLLASLFTTGLCFALFLSVQQQPLVYWFGGWTPRNGVAIGISFFVDPAGAGLATLSGLLVSAALIFSWRYFDKKGALYQVLMLVFLAALCGFSLTADLFNMFVFFEVMGAAAVALCAYKSEEGGPLQGALNFGITNTIGAFMALIGLGLIYARTGALNLAQMGRTLVDAHSTSADTLLLVGMGLIFACFFIKAAVVPFHFWLPDAHAVAPTPVCILFSGIMVEAGLYAAVRVYWTMFSGMLAPQADLLRGILLGFGILAALVGGVMCVAQHHIKRLLAFSTVSHMGLMTIAFGLLTTAGLGGLAVYLLGHSMVKAALFLSAGILLHRFGSVEELDLRGKGRKVPLAGIVFLLGGLGLAALPPFGTFLGETLIDEAAEKLDLSWLSVVFFAVAVLTGGAVLRVTGRVFLGLGEGREEETPEDPKEKEKPETKAGHDHTPLPMLVMPVVLLIFGLLMTFIPGTVRAADMAAIHIEDRHAYAARVLDTAAPAPPEPEPHESVLPGVLRGIGGSGGALALALASLALGRRRRDAQQPWKALGGAVGALRGLHTGRLGDYVTWLTVGTAALGISLLALLR